MHGEIVPFLLPKRYEVFRRYKKTFLLNNGYRKWLVVRRRGIYGATSISARQSYFLTGCYPVKIAALIAPLKAGGLRPE